MHVRRAMHLTRNEGPSGWTHVTPVEQDGCAEPDPGIPGVGVTVDQDVRQPAGSCPGKSLSSTAGKLAQDRVARSPASHDGLQLLDVLYHLSFHQAGVGVCA